MFDPTTLIGLHTWISLVAILLGGVAVAGLARGKAHPYRTDAFMAAALATSLSGFCIPAAAILPSHIVGVIALAAFMVWLVARAAVRPAGAWRVAYATSVVVSLYLIVFVGIAQAFQKIPALSSTMPHGLLAALLLSLALFGYLIVLTTKRGRGPLARTQANPA